MKENGRNVSNMEMELIYTIMEILILGNINLVNHVDMGNTSGRMEAFIQVSLQTD